MRAWLARVRQRLARLYAIQPRLVWLVSSVALNAATAVFSAYQLYLKPTAVVHAFCLGVNLTCIALLGIDLALRRSAIARELFRAGFHAGWPHGWEYALKWHRQAMQLLSPEAQREYCDALDRTLPESVTRVSDAISRELTSTWPKSL
jgi:hypothetical protein